VFMVPAVILGVDSYPLNANGKTDRKKLLELEMAKRAEREYVAPATDAEAALAKIVAEIMKVERVGVTDNLFEIGLDSLKIFQITSRAGAAGLKITPRAILQARTIRAALEATPAAASATLGGSGTIKQVARQRVKLATPAPSNGDVKK
jgi:aryl carrier-like protein